MSTHFIPANRLLAQLRCIVGDPHVLVGSRRTRWFRKGYRYGDGPALAVVRPGSLLEMWRAFKAVVEAARIVIVQGANTGLNGGSSPFGDDYDREIVIINTLRIDRIDVLGSGKQVLCLAGATLYDLERKISRLGREPHSVIGSTTIGASVVGGVCNNSGGALLRRGPAFTQLALFARVDKDGTVSLVNHLGIDLGTEPEEILQRLDRGAYAENDIRHDPDWLASDPHYVDLVRDIDSPLPGRYNNDPRLLFEASGSAGKLCIFAVRLDTFPGTGRSRVFYIGSNDYMELTTMRRHILSSFKALPVAGEYLHRDAYRLSEDYGKDLFLFLKYAGTRWMSSIFRIKSRIDNWTGRLGLGTTLSDRVLQTLSQLAPQHLPARMKAYRDTYEHYVLMRVEEQAVEEARSYLSSIFPSASGDYFECSADEAASAFRHRYAVGGACIRYRALHPETVENIVAIDLALPRDRLDWRESLPQELEPLVVKKILTGHFFCYAFHHDYAVKKGVDWMAFEQSAIGQLGRQRIEFPSEHNVGHLYEAKPALVTFYRSLDPTNTMNPGIGRTSRRKDWA